MSMFDNIILDEFTMLDEGKQADEYRKRKAKEANSNYKKTMDRVSRYSGARISQHGEDDTDKHMQYAAEKAMKSSPKFKKEFMDATKDEGSTRKSREGLSKAIYAADAMDRHGRRHKSSKTESALMLIAGYESEFAY